MHVQCSVHTQCTYTVHIHSGLYAHMRLLQLEGMHISCIAHAAHVQCACSVHATQACDLCCSQYVNRGARCVYRSYESSQRMPGFFWTTGFLLLAFLLQGNYYYEMHQ